MLAGFVHKLRWLRVEKGTAEPAYNNTNDK